MQRNELGHPERRPGEVFLAITRQLTCLRS